MANRRYIDFPIASSVGDSDIILIWQSGANKQTTKATFLSGLPENLDELNDVAISGLTNGQILRYDSVTGKWENTDQGNLDLNDLNDVSIVSPSNGQVLVYNSSTSRWENSSGGYVPYTGAVTTVNLGAQTIQAGSFVKAGGTAAQFLKANGSVDSTAYGTGSVTSVALTMPSAFSVANSPVTTAGTLEVTGAGTVGQYIRGDGSLADFPESSGGGSSVSYYLNGSVAQGTIGGVAYKELNKVPILGAGTDFTINANGYIASFITDAGDPNLLEIPAGNWTFETYFSSSSNGGSPSFYVELYKVNSGGTATLIASNSTFPELIAFGTNVISYFSTLAVPTTALALTDRLAIRYYVTHSGRTITLHTEDNHLCQIITTFTTGLTALNGLTAQIQNFAVGTSGTDFAISSATATHTFNLPTASATNRGALSSADWTTFNGKTSNLGTVTSVGLSSATSGVTIGSSPVTTSGTITLAIATASGSQNGLLSSTDWTTFNSKQNALTNPVTGTGTTNYLAKFTGASTIGNSNIQDSGTLVSVGSAATFTGSVTATNYSFSGAIPSTAASTGYLDYSGATTRLFSVGTSGSTKGAFQFIAKGADNSSNLPLTITDEGKVGIGTTTPGTILDVKGAFATNSSMQIDNGGPTYGNFMQSNGSAGYDRLSILGSDIQFYGSGTVESMRITTNRNLHIGTFSSDNGARLQVSGTATVGGQLKVIYSSASIDAIIFEDTRPTSSSGTWRIGAGTGGVGFGIYSNTLASTPFFLAASTGAATFSSSVTANSSIISTTAFGGTFTTSDGTNQVRFGSYFNSIGAGNSYDGVIYTTSASGALYFLTGGSTTSRMLITSGGNVLIGTTTDSGHKLRVNGTALIGSNFSNFQTSNKIVNSGSTATFTYNGDYGTGLGDNTSGLVIININEPNANINSAAASYIGNIINPRGANATLTQISILLGGGVAVFTVLASGNNINVTAIISGGGQYRATMTFIGGGGTS